MPSWNVYFDLGLQASSQQMVADLAQIHALSGVIRDIPIPPSVQHRLDRLNILRAVRGTTGIEGTELSEEEVIQIMDAAPETSVLGVGREREEQETRNAEALMRYVSRLLDSEPATPVSEDLICRFHQILTQGIDYRNNTPGRYRTHSVNVGAYRPPASGEEVRHLMTEFVWWLNTGHPAGWDQVLQAIVAHFFLVSIHPFGDGNGRTSRAVESFLLYKAGVNVRGYYSLSNYYYQNRPDYVAYLNRVQLWGDNDLTPFVAFAVRGLVQELKAVHKEVLDEVKIIAFRDYAREMLSERLGTAAGHRLLRFLSILAGGAASVRELHSGSSVLAGLYKDVSKRTLYRDLAYLKENNLVEIDEDVIKAKVDLMSRFTA